MEKLGDQKEEIENCHSCFLACGCNINHRGLVSPNQMRSTGENAHVPQLLLLHACRDLSSRPPALAVPLTAWHVGSSPRWDLSPLLQCREQIYSVVKRSLGGSELLFGRAHPSATGSCCGAKVRLKEQYGK